tara:strand:- start:11548 stop:12651 length:1104 start_codon:yes stop_codon:yes gene_type:complete
MEDEMQTVNDNSEINDLRSPPDFKGVTLSGFKKTEVRNTLIESIKKNKPEEACYWSAELICGGHYIDLWEIYIHYCCKYIHLGNPKIIIYLEKRYQIFKNIMSQGNFLNELQLRNHPTIRQMFAEITCTICQSERKTSIEQVKIKREEELDISQVSEKLIAPHVKFIEPIFRKDDPKEYFIPANEFAFNISKEKKNMLNACYWIEWTIEFDNLCKKRKNKCVCESRNFVKVEAKYRNDLIWIIWDCMLHYGKGKNNIFVNELLNCMFELFCVKYTTASCKKRRYLLYFAVSILTENVSNQIELISNKEPILLFKKKINTIYKQIKKNEQSPNTEYLFANIEKENAFEKSMKKMQLLNNIDGQKRNNS